MIFEWTPVTLAKISLMIMFIPAGLTVFTVIASILMAMVAELTGIKKDSKLGKKIDLAAGNIFYLTYISVFIINIMAAGLLISGVWALVNWVAGLF